MKRIHKIIQLHRRQLHFHLPPSGLDSELPALPPHPVVTLQLAQVREVAIPSNEDQALACKNTNIATTSTVNTAVTMKLKK